MMVQYTGSDFDEYRESEKEKKTKKKKQVNI